MPLDRVHDVCLALLAISVALALVGVLFRHTPKAAQCPRCLYRHAMAEAPTCPECGHTPRSASAWTSRRPRLPRPLRRWNLTALPVLLAAVASIGVLHGRWAATLPNAALVSTLPLMGFGTTTGQTRVLEQIDLRDFTPAQGDRIVHAALSAYARWEPASPTSSSALVSRNSWRAKRLNQAVSLRLDEAGIVISLGRPTPLDPTARGPRFARGAPFLAESSVELTPAICRGIVQGVADSDPVRAQLAHRVIAALESRARIMGPDLLRTLGSSPTTLPPGDQYLARAILVEPDSVREFLQTAPDSQRQQLLNIAQREVRAMPAKVLDVFHDFIDSPSAAPLKTDEFRAEISLHFPRGPEQWRNRTSRSSPAWSIMTRF